MLVRSNQVNLFRILYNFILFLAARFGLLEAKVMLFYLVKNFSLEKGSKTVIPIKLSTYQFQPIPIDGFWINFVPRKTQ